MRPLCTIALLLAMVAPVFAAEKPDCGPLAGPSVMARAETQLDRLARELTDLTEQPQVRANLLARDPTLLKTKVPEFLGDIRQLQALQRARKISPAEFQERFAKLHFVADLLQGVFDANVDASLRQMESYAELVGCVGKTVKAFADARCGPAGAKGRTTPIRKPPDGCPG